MRALSLIKIPGQGGNVPGETPPASPVNAVQFNNNGLFGGTSNFLWDNTNTILSVTGQVNASGFITSNSSVNSPLFKLGSLLNITTSGTTATAQYQASTTPTSIQIFNTVGGGNSEFFELGWKHTSNIFVFNTASSGSGVIRPMAFANQLSFNTISAIAAPTSWITLPAVTATAGSSPLKLLSSSGILMTTPEDGAIEYDGSHFWGTIGGTRFQLDNGEGLNPGGTNGQLQFNNNSVFGGSSSLTWNTTNNRLKIGNSSTAASSPLDVIIDNLASGSTGTNGISLSNTTASTSSVNEQSPGLHFKGSSWNSNDSASYTADWRIRLIPQTASVPNSSNADLLFEFSTNNLSYTNGMILQGVGTNTPTLAVSNINAGNVTVEHLNFSGSSSIQSIGNNIEIINGTNPTGLIITNTSGTTSETATLGFTVLPNVFYIGTAASASGTVRPVIIANQTSIGDTNSPVNTSLRIAAPLNGSNFNLQTVVSDPTSPNSGDIWFDGTNLYLYSSNGTTRLSNQTIGSRVSIPGSVGQTTYTVTHNANSPNYSVSVLPADANSVGPFYVNNLTNNSFNIVYLTPPSGGINILYTLLIKD